MRAQPQAQGKEACALPWLFQPEEGSLFRKQEVLFERWESAFLA
jgi:hypothetical protein